MTLSVEPIGKIVITDDGREERKRILVCIGRYLPGNMDGGPIRSVSNMVAFLSQFFDFYVVTRDRDITDADTFPGVMPRNWHRVGDAKVLYCSSVGPAILRRAFREVRPHLIYLNDCWNDFTRYMVLLRRVGAFGKTPMVLAPRGDFSPGAMGIKRTKKRLYLQAARLLGLHNNLIWQASTPREKEFVLRAAPAARIEPDSIHVAYTLTDAISSTAAHPAKQPGSLKLAFISRMSEMKNLLFLLEILPDIQGDVELNLFGPVAEKDVAYWESCKEQLSQLSDKSRVEYRGALDHSAVPQVLHEHHFFILPTKGENFCHSAVESFVNGTPVVLSNETPWTNLKEVHAGFDIALTDRAGWVAALQECVEMDQQTYALFLGGAQKYGERFSTKSAVDQHIAMFEAALKHAC